METWDTLRRAIPDGAAKIVANRLGVSAPHVRRWRRQPESDEAPLASGQRSPLDRVLDLIDASFLVSPAGAAFIVDHIGGHYHDLVRASIDPDHWDKRSETADLLRETTEAVNALNLDAPESVTIQELVEARDAIDRALQHLRIRTARRFVDDERPSDDESGRETAGNVSRPLGRESR